MLIEGEHESKRKWNKGYGDKKHTLELSRCIIEQVESYWCLQFIIEESGKLNKKINYKMGEDYLIYSEGRFFIQERNAKSWS